MMAKRRVPVLFARILVLLAIASGGGLATPARAQEITTDSAFADAPFDKWQAEGPREQVPWQVQMLAEKLSFHQRLIATIKVQVPGPELLKRSHDERLLLLVEVRNGQGVSSRNYGLLELNNLKPEMKRSDVEFSWQAFAVPGQYEVAVALWDKKSGEHNFMHRLFHVDAYKGDPLPGMWRGLDAFEFWSTRRDGPEYMFHSDVEGHLYLPLKTKRPIHLEVLLDLTPSADIFRGNVGRYNSYLAKALPIFKLFSQITITNGSRGAAALDLVQRRTPFEQDDAKDLDWARLSKALAPDNSPGVVSVKDLHNRKQSPVYLREELVRRLGSPDSAGKQDERPVRVFIVVGTSMDFYSFPALPAIETGNEGDCVVYYVQIDIFEYQGFNGGAGNVEKMLKPLKMRTFHVGSPDDVRQALAKVMDEMGRF
ncbi:MAG TPA: hypothetical protein VH724_20510 [Candidatus Angelobacter sp.]|nr:hypothetical protein [Candidatus Angelobacter sp.]